LDEQTIQYTGGFILDRPISAPGTQTALAHYAEDRREYHGAVIPPIFETSLFTFASVEDMDDAFDHGEERYVYTRGGNPTTVQAEEKIAFLEKGEKAKLFSSGMAAISSAILHCVRAGSHIVCVNGCYGVTRSLLTSYPPSSTWKARPVSFSKCRTSRRLRILRDPAAFKR
jgi:cystathionine beta-lyase/cystathionine gamma-synthase